MNNKKNQGFFSACFSVYFYICNKNLYFYEREISTIPSVILKKKKSYTFNVYNWEY